LLTVAVRELRRQLPPDVDFWVGSGAEREKKSSQHGSEDMENETAMTWKGE